jgi:hypothetical protein
LTRARDGGEGRKKAKAEVAELSTRSEESFSAQMCVIALTGFAELWILYKVRFVVVR